MSADIIQLTPEAFQTELRGLVKNSIEETLNVMLDEEAKKLVYAERYAGTKREIFIVPGITIESIRQQTGKYTSGCPR